MICSVSGTPHCCINKQAQWGDWVMVDFPSNVPNLHKLGRGSNGGFYKCKFKKSSAGGTLSLMVAPAERESLQCDYPHVMINLSASGVVFDYHYSPSADGQRTGKAEDRKTIKKLSAIPGLVEVIVGVVKKDPKVLLSILGNLGGS